MCMFDWNVTFLLSSYSWPWLCTCGSRLCWFYFGLFPLCLSLIVTASNWDFMSLWPRSILCQSKLQEAVMCSWLVSCQMNKMNSQVERVCICSWQLWGPAITQQPAEGCCSLSLFSLCALTRFSPKLRLGPEWSLCFSHLPYHTSCTTIGGHNVFTMPSGGRERTQIKPDRDIHDGREHDSLY